MTVKEITGVRELTAQECVEINGGAIQFGVLIYYFGKACIFVAKSVAAGAIAYGTTEAINYFRFS